MPKYKGLNTFARMLENKEKKAGCTVHYVNTKLDGGNIIIQKSFFVDAKDNVFDLKKRLRHLNIKFYLKRY